MEINHYIDYTFLKSDATMEEMETFCEKAKENHYTCVCVTPYYTALVSALLKDSNVLVASVIGYPFGMSTLEVKSYEAIDAINNGADEIDFFLNAAIIKNKEYEELKDEIEEIRDSIDGKPLKVILNGEFTEEELIKVVEISNETYVHYLGFFKTDGTTKNMLMKLKEHGNGVLEWKVFTSDLSDETILSYIESGVTRISVLEEE